jgi:hypothetical protein
MNAPMFGITIPAKNPPNFCIAERQPVALASPAIMLLIYELPFCSSHLGGWDIYAL